MLLEIEGKEVRGSDGVKLGKVVRADPDEFVVEHGIFKVHSFAAPNDEISMISEGEVYLRRPAEAYREGAPHRDWSSWHSGRRDAEGRSDVEGLARADREHRLGAQGHPELKATARTSLHHDSDILADERDDRMGQVGRRAEKKPDHAKHARGSPPEAQLPPLEHPEDDPWP